MNNYLKKLNVKLLIIIFFIILVAYSFFYNEYFKKFTKNIYNMFNDPVNESQENELKINASKLPSSQQKVSQVSQFAASQQRESKLTNSQQKVSQVSQFSASQQRESKSTSSQQKVSASQSTSSQQKVSQLTYSQQKESQVEASQLSASQIAASQLTDSQQRPSNNDAPQLTDFQVNAEIIEASQLTDYLKKTSSVAESQLTGSQQIASTITGSQLTGSQQIASTITGSQLTGSQLTGSQLMASNVGASQLTGSQLTGSQLMASNVGASQLTGSQLIASNLGASQLTSSQQMSSTIAESQLIVSQQMASQATASQLTGSLVAASQLNEFQINASQNKASQLNTPQLTNVNLKVWLDANDYNTDNNYGYTWENRADTTNNFYTNIIASKNTTDNTIKINAPFANKYFNIKKIYTMFVVGYFNTSNNAIGGQFITGKFGGQNEVYFGKNGSNYATFNVIYDINKSNNTNNWNTSNNLLDGKTVSVTGSLKILSITCNSNELILHYNALKMTSKNIIHNQSDINVITIGEGNTGCNIGEILIYDVELFDHNREIIEGYLAHKWTLTSILPDNHPYKNIKPDFNTQQTYASQMPTYLLNASQLKASQLFMPQLNTLKVWLDANNFPFNNSSQNTSIIDDSILTDSLLNASTITASQLTGSLQNASAIRASINSIIWINKADTTKNFTITPTPNPNIDLITVNNNKSVYIKSNNSFSNSSLNINTKYTMFVVGYFDFTQNINLSFSTNTGYGTFIQGNSNLSEIYFGRYGDRFGLFTRISNTSGWDMKDVELGTQRLPINNSLKILCVISNNKELMPYYNALNIIPVKINHTQKNLTNITIGAIGAYISEILIYNTDLFDDNRQIVEGYLAHKWGLTGDLPDKHPYKTVKPNYSP
jgi:hypothetical protein